MAITVTGANPTTITAVSNTVTTNTVFNTNAPNDRLYLIAGDLIGAVDPGVAVGGFGLFLEPTTVGSRLDFTNNGFVSVDQPTHALDLRTSGGVATYAGAGTVINSGGGVALSLVATLGVAEATIGGTLISNIGTTAGVAGSTGVVFEQLVGSLISNTIGAGGDGVRATADTGDIEATIAGTIVANLAAFSVATNGNITVDFTGTLTANTEEGIDAATLGVTVINSSGTINAPRGIQAVGTGVGLITVNVTDGQINTTSVGMELVSSGTGGVVVDMTGGQIGSAAQRAGGVGIIAQANGTAGALVLTVSSVWSTAAGIIPSIGDATSAAAST